MALSEEQTIGIKCIKYLLCLSNFAFVITALLIISVGTTIFTIYNDFNIFLEKSYFSPSICLILIGLLLLSISLFGFMGTLKESTCMISMFSVMLIVVLICELAVVITAYITPSGVDEYVEKSLRFAMEHYNENDENTKALDYLHSAANCCGVNNYTDWAPMEYPQSCCYSYQYSKETCSIKDIREDGCLLKLKFIVYQSRYLIASMALCVAFVQALGICFSCALGRSIRRAKTERDIRRMAFRSQFINGHGYTPSFPENVKTPVLYTPTSSDA